MVAVVAGVLLLLAAWLLAVLAALQQVATLTTQVALVVAVLQPLATAWLAAAVGR
jgi:hypothetical protein